MATVLNQKRQAEILHGNGVEGGGGGLAVSKIMSKAVVGKPPVARKPAGKTVDKEWNVRPRIAALESRNPIRDIVETKLKPNPNLGKKPISLAQGDPTVYGHLKVPESACAALAEVATSYKYNGYAHSAGILECRSAVADFHSEHLPFELTPEDVGIVVGCSQAIEFSIACLAAEGSNMLVPRPGFPIYDTFCRYYGVEVRYYDLLPERGWEVDLEQVAELADDDTAAMILCNPSNPCGTSFSYQHLSQIAGLCEKLKLPIISDEIYEHMLFGEKKFTPMATFSLQVPVLTVGGISKRWLAPGWRLGWILICDPCCILEKSGVVEALKRIMQMTIGTSVLVQAAVPAMLQNTTPEFYKQTMKTLEDGCDCCYRRIQGIVGLDVPTKPDGAMYMMAKVDPSAFKDIPDDTVFAEKLVKEENIVVLPGSAFGIHNWLRLVFATPVYMLEEAFDRIEAFCLRHASVQN
uniref:Tyrosine aminotransferase n=1 Tax=Anthoceros agrestis TaxID=41834 RepID=A0A8E3Z7M3_9EMBR|nr:tyrosine aminotransferase [Anthoceros agrestis]